MQTVITASRAAMPNRGTLLTPSNRREAVLREGGRGCDYEPRQRSGPGHCLAPPGNPRGDRGEQHPVAGGFQTRRPKKDKVGRKTREISTVGYLAFAKQPTGGPLAASLGFLHRAAYE